MKAEREHIGPLRLVELIEFQESSRLDLKSNRETMLYYYSFVFRTIRVVR